MQAYVRGAKALGVEITERAQATGIELAEGRVAGVRTVNGTISTPVVVNATGAAGEGSGKLGRIRFADHELQAAYLHHRRVPTNTARDSICDGP